MLHIEDRLAEAGERQARFRAEAERQQFARFGRRRFRRSVGESLVRLGRQVGGDALTGWTPPITQPAERTAPVGPHRR